jgi:hypothetical protein
MTFPIWENMQHMDKESRKMRDFTAPPGGRLDMLKIFKN